MQRDSSTSDWDVVGTPISQHNPAPAREPLTRAPESFNSDDFFNSEGFYRVGSRSETAEGGDHRVGRRETFNASDDGDVESSPTRPLAPRPPPSTGAAAATANDAVSAVPAGQYSANAPQLPEEIGFVRGLPSSISVDSIFNAGVLTHFSPGKTKGPAESTLSESSPSGSPVPSTESAAARAVVLPTHNEVPRPAPLRFHEMDTVDSSEGTCCSFRPLAAAATNRRATTCDASFETDQQPLPHHGDGSLPFLSAHAGVHSNAATVAFPMPARLPRIFSSDGPFTDDSSSPSWTSWHNPMESLVKCAMLMLLLDAVHQWSGATWIGLAGRTMLALMSLGKVARVVYGRSAFVSSPAFRERLHQIADNTREQVVERTAVGVGMVARFVCSPSQPPPTSDAAPSQNPLVKWEKLARGVLVLGVVDTMLIHSPLGATRPLDFATFWAAFVCLRVPAAHAASYVATLERTVDPKHKNATVSFLFQYVTVPSASGRGVVAVQPQIAGVAWYICLQALFSACRSLSS